MASNLISLLAGLLAGLVVTSAGQRVDDFTCPDTLPGFYPHLYSCDKYWACNDGQAEQRTCGNGLGFLDTDETFTLEQCAELHLVECGERTELEPPISSPHCPRAWGTYEDEEDCSVFWVCQAGKANRYECPPGLAYDKESRGCRWADQVAECSSLTVLDQEGGQFQCPKSAPGVFTKHAHPADCRQYFLCISGVPREYGCPLGTVFNTGTGNGADGECSDPEVVPECREYYGEQEFDARELSSNGFSVGQEAERERSRSSNTKLSRNSLGRPRAGEDLAVKSEELSRPAPVALQEILDRPSSSRARPARPPQTQFLPTSPPPPPSTTTQRPARLEVITNRPSLRKTFRQTLQTTPPTTSPTTQTSFSRARPFSSRFGNNNSPRLSIGSSNRFRPTPPPPPPTTTTTTTTSPPPPPPPARGEGLPAPVKAAPGPNGEDYYYYYYYYDDEEQV